MIHTKISFLLASALALAFTVQAANGASLNSVGAIKERAIVENGQVVAATMMYIALSYDHRIIDGKDAVLFLVDIKNQLENPHRMLLGM